MRPVKGSEMIGIPITFDNRGGGERTSSKGKPLWVFLLLLIWSISVVMGFIAFDWVWKLLYPVITFILVVWIIRFIIIKERFYKKRRRELVSNKYMFSHSVFWNILEVSGRYPYIVSYGNGMKGVFVALNKDVTVGQSEDAEFYHHESIKEALQQMKKRKIECIHVDYMDTAGKDPRMVGLFSQVEKTENGDLRRIMLSKFDHMERVMNRSYSAYDVYAFYYSGREDIFWDDLQDVIDYFLEANYIDADILDKHAISELTKSIINIEDFSADRASESLFKEMNRTMHIRPIWTEKDGERTILNKTKEEMEEFKRVAKMEKRVKRRGTGIKSKFGRKKVEEDIDLFD